MHRKIIHLDLDAFFCAVEELQNPGLAGKPFAVGGKPSERGVVASCSYAARMFGIRSAMPMMRAIRLCPELIIVRSNHDLYQDMSQKVMAHLENLSPLVEQISIDEAFMDVSDLQEEVRAIAVRLQNVIRTSLNLPCSLGVATNKMVAKIATDIGKAANRSANPPRAITVVPPGEEAAFLAPLPVDALWGVGQKTAERLHELNILTIGDLARQSELDMLRWLGKPGVDMLHHARGIDTRPVITLHELKSISQETTFVKDIQDEAALRKTIIQLAEGVGRRTRHANLSGRTVKIKVRWPDFTTLTRQVSLSQATDQDQEIIVAANQLFSAVWQTGKAVRLIGVGLSGLENVHRQLGFWDKPAQKERRLLEVLDELHEKYGEGSVQRGRNLEPRPPAPKTDKTGRHT